MDHVLFEIVVVVAAACAVGTFVAQLVWQGLAAAVRAMRRDR